MEKDFIHKDGKPLSLMTRLSLRNCNRWGLRQASVSGMWEKNIKGVRH